MNKIIFISPFEISKLNGLTSFSNAEPMLEYLNPIDYHSILFSTLYQSGINYFEVYQKNLPKEITQNRFWVDRLVEHDYDILDECYEKATKVLEALFYRDIDKEYNVALYGDVLDYFVKLFYSFRTGTPHINPGFVSQKEIESLKPRMDRGLLIAIQNFASTIQNEKIQTVVPINSVLRKDVKRFEEICNTQLFRDYSNSLLEMPECSKMHSIKKEINVKALKLFNKYGDSFYVKESTFNFIKFNKKVLDLFVSKMPSLIGEIIISASENYAKQKKKIYYYDVNDAKYSVLLCSRIDEVVKQGGLTRLRSITEKMIATDSNSVQSNQ